MSSNPTSTLYGSNFVLTCDDGYYFHHMNGIASTFTCNATTENSCTADWSLRQCSRMYMIFCYVDNLTYY